MKQIGNQYSMSTIDSSSILDNAIQKIKDRINERVMETHSLASRIGVLSGDIEHIESDLITQGNAVGGYSVNADEFDASLRKLVSLGHDIEVVLREKTWLTRAGIDLVKLFDPIEQNLKLGLGFRLEQDGPARIIHSAENNCLFAQAGGAAVDIPIKLTRPGAVEQGRINANLGLRNPSGRRDRFERFISRGTHACPPGTFTRTVRLAISEHVGSIVSKSAGPLPMIDLPQLPIGQPAYYAGRFGDLISLPATVRKRPRFAVLPLSSLPDWADAALKLVPITIVRYIEDRIRQAGADPQGGFFVSSKNSFDINARKIENHTRRIGCVDFGIVVTVDLKLRCQLQIDSENNLIVTVRDIDRRFDVKIEPRFIGWLFDEFMNVAERIAEAILRIVNISEPYKLSGIKRAEIEINQDRFVLYLKTRELPYN